MSDQHCVCLKMNLNKICQLYVSSCLLTFVMSLTVGPNITGIWPRTELWKMKPDIHYLTDTPVHALLRHSHTYCTHTHLPIGPPSAPKQIKAFTVLSRTLTCSGWYACSRAQQQQQHEPLTPPTFPAQFKYLWGMERGKRLRRGRSNRTVMRLVCQQQSARKCDRALEEVSKSISCSCPSTSAADDGSAGSYCVLLWRGGGCWGRGGGGGGEGVFAGAHMPKNDASPLICSSVSHMNSSAARHTQTHSHTHAHTHT